MFPLLTGLVTGGASLLGNLFSSQTSAQNTQAQIQAQEAMQQQTESFNEAETEGAEAYNSGMVANQQQYETNMSNTAYQRATNDMKAAGLNPAMMFSSGSAASTPSISAPSAPSASVGTPTVPVSQKQSPLGGLGQAVSAGVNSAISAETFDKMTQEIANLRTQQAKTAAETITEEGKPALQAAQEAATRSSAFKTETETQDIANKMPIGRLAGDQASAIAKLPQWLQDSAAQAGFLGKKADDMISPVLNSASSIFKWMPKTVERSRSSAGGGSFDEFYKERTGF